MVSRQHVHNGPFKGDGIAMTKVPDHRPGKGKTGKFNLPLSTSQSTGGARAAYRRDYGFDWPHDDEYLRTLAKEVPRGIDGRCNYLLTLMRENHQTTPAGSSKQSAPVNLALN